jgi:hypothetical protein
MVLSAIAVSAAGLPVIFADRPPLAHTGGFGENTCHECHSDASLNEAPGILALEGIPPTYVPGTVYPITVRLARLGLARGGFELAARIADGTNVGKQAGIFDTVDAGATVTDTTISGFGVIRYARHRRAANQRDSVRWVVKWTAPAGKAGAVVFHAAGNAANDDDSPLGDYIYTASGVSRP